MKFVSSGSSWLSPSTVIRVTRSGYGQGRIKNQPGTIGAAVPTARVSKKPEVFPGKIACAIVEKTNADNPKPEKIIPVTVVLYIQERDEHSQRHRSKIVTDDLVREAFRNGVQCRRVTRITADPGEEPEQDEGKQCSTSSRFRVIFRGIIHSFYTEVPGQKQHKGERQR